MSDKAIMIASAGLVFGGLLLFLAIEPSAPSQTAAPVSVSGAVVATNPDMSHDEVPTGDQGQSQAVAQPAAETPSPATVAAPAPPHKIRYSDDFGGESDASGKSKYEVDGDSVPTNDEVESNSDSSAQSD